MRRAIISLFICTLVIGCLRMGQASDEDKQQLDAWSAIVTDKDHAEVQREAAFHTDWMEKKKVQWMAQQYKSRWMHEQAKAAATQAATRAATQSTTAPTTAPTTKTTSP